MYHNSIIDTDLYKLTIQQAYLFKYPKIKGRYELITRDNRDYPEGFGNELRRIVDNFQLLRLQKSEKDFLISKCYYLTPAYLDFLNGFEYDTNEVIIKQVGSKLSVVCQGHLYRIVLWEVPLMATISELYFTMTNAKINDWQLLTETNKKKAEGLADLDVYYSEFGTRRRFSYQNQGEVISDLLRFGKNHMIGTSNVHFAQTYDLLPMGTIAHEWYMLHGALFGYQLANKLASDVWIDVYQGDLGIGLSDTFTTDVFLKTFNSKYAKLFDGLRQDSANPLDFIDKAETHYKSLRINSLTKTALFSDNLNSLEKIAKIKNACKNRILDKYGIGTWFTNDVGVKPMNIVIKLMAVDAGNGWIKTVKLSDDISKNTGDSEEVSLCKRVLGI